MTQTGTDAGASGYGDYPITDRTVRDQRPAADAGSPVSDSLPAVDRDPLRQETEAARQIRQIGLYIERLRVMERQNPNHGQPGEADTPSLKRLIDRENEIGAEVFGSVPPNRTRQFYCIDHATWVWYEEWTDSEGARRALTTRYEIRGDAVLKTQGSEPRKLRGEELYNLADAVQSYYSTVVAVLYARHFAN